jgi:ABC-type Zn uptake system ZnuABC Zn-binding protein ZnuA
MKYTKPEVVSLDNAIRAIQSSTDKLCPAHPDGATTFNTNAAYEADE